MRKLIRKVGLIILSCLLMSPVAPFAASQPSTTQDQVLGDARLSLIQGDVVLQTEETGSEWGAAVINIPLLPGTKLWAPETGRSEIQFFGGSSLRMDSNTELNISDLRMEDSGHVIQVGVPEGRVYIHYVGSQVPNSVFQIDTPITSIVSYDPSRFDVNVNEDGYTEVTVFNGSIYIQSQNGSTKVNEGMMLAIDSSQTAETSPMRPEDAWLRWNFSRDSALANTGPSRRYLPSSLGVYGNDFDTYGHCQVFLQTGHRIESEDGAGSAVITSGYPMSHGGGSPIIMEDGPLLTAWVGAGCHLQVPHESTGPPALLHGSRPLRLFHGFLLLRVRSITVIGTMDLTA
jgi:hypothetical protein